MPWHAKAGVTGTLAKWCKERRSRNLGQVTCGLAFAGIEILSHMRAQMTTAPAQASLIGTAWIASGPCIIEGQPTRWLCFTEVNLLKHSMSLKFRECFGIFDENRRPVARKRHLILT